MRETPFDQDPVGHTGSWFVLLARRTANPFPSALPWFAVDGEWFWLTLLWIAVVLSLITAVHYLWYSRITERALAEQGSN